MCSILYKRIKELGVFHGHQDFRKNLNFSIETPIRYVVNILTKQMKNHTNRNGFFPKKYMWKQDIYFELYSVTSCNNKMLLSKKSPLVLMQWASEKTSKFVTFLDNEN